ncbi:MAG: septation protein A [Gammaproteobacteria bacterium]|nr:septation protein A [Gammaproteobacteria bacterium]
MKFLFDFFPVILFFVVFKSYDNEMVGIIAATKVMIAASVVQISLFWIKNRRFENMHLITLVLVVVLGGATIYFENADFIKWKPTAVNWLFGIVFFASEYIGKKSIIRRMMESNISLPDPIWTRLNISWALFFVLLGTINLYVAFQYSLDTWVEFKTYGLLGLTFAFVILQAVYMAKYVDTGKQAVENSSSDD